MLTVKRKESVFEEVFYNTKDRVYRFLKKILADDHTVEDCMQQCYMRFWERIEKLDHQNDPLPLLYVYARNIAIDELRKRNRNLVTKSIDEDAEDIADNNSADQQLHSRQAETRIHRLLNNMPVRRRQVYKMIKIEGYSHKETAQVLNISQSTVEKHIMEAVKFITPEKLR